MPKIPVIDMSREPESLSQACRSYGFFQITGHGIPPELIAGVRRVSREFFDLPMAEKRKLIRTFNNTMGYFDRELTKTKRDQKEIFDFINTPFPDLADDHPKNLSAVDGYNQWPENLPEFQSTLKEYFSACAEVSHKILEAFCADLDIENDFFRNAFGANHTSFLRLNHYPVEDVLGGDEKNDAQKLGDKALHPHTDAGGLTILLQDSVGGLQVKVGNEWIDVEPVEGAFVINVGDLMQIWSNDSYKAARHRVRPITEVSRFSVPFFFNPAYETICKPIVKSGERPVYRPVKWGDFRAKRAEGDFADYGEEIQITDFRI